MKPNKVNIILGIFVLFPFMVNAKTSAYRRCVKMEFTQWTKNEQCDDFRNLSLETSRVFRECAPLIHNEADIEDSNFSEIIDNLKRGAQGDIDELAQSKADRCGLKLEMTPNGGKISSDYAQ